jgi:hypothetical protein
MHLDHEQRCRRIRLIWNLIWKCMKLAEDVIQHNTLELMMLNIVTDVNFVLVCCIT